MTFPFERTKISQKFVAFLVNCDQNINICVNTFADTDPWPICPRIHFCSIVRRSYFQKPKTAGHDVRLVPVGPVSTHRPLTPTETRISSCWQFGWHRRHWVLSLWMSLTHWYPSCYDANFLVLGSTTGCRYDNSRFHQWRECWHRDDSSFSVFGSSQRDDLFQWIWEDPQEFGDRDSAGKTSDFGWKQGPLSWCLILKSNICISFENRNLRVPDPQMSYRNLTAWQGTRTAAQHIEACTKWLPFMQPTLTNTVSWNTSFRFKFVLDGLINNSQHLFG